MAESKRRELGVDEALAHVNEFGLAQKIQTALCGISWAVAAFQTSIAIFSGLGADPQKLNIVECVKTGDVACEGALAQPYPAMCTLPREAWHWKTTPGYSLVTEFDLVCNEAWQVHMAASSFFMGVLAGCILCQLLSERVSRRRLLYFGCLAAGVAGCMAATAPFLWTFILFRALTGVGVGAMGVASFVLAADLTGASWRPFTGVFMHGGFSCGAALATLLAWIVPGWRLLTLFCALLPLVLAATTWSLMIESPKWLLLRGRKGEATAALAAAAFTNRTRLPEHPLADPTDLLSNPHRGTVDVLRSARLRHRVLLLGGAWSAATVAYYASALLPDALSSGDRSGDGSAMEVAFTGFAYELPGVAAAALAAERLGRKHAILGGLVEAGATLLGAGIASGDVQRALAVAARFGLAAACSALYMLSWELFPVVVQQPGMALANLAARGGAIAAPWLAYAAVPMASPTVPLLVAGALCLGGAALVALLPETLGVAVPETIQEMNAAAVKRHRSWTHSLRNVFRPSPVLHGAPTGAMSLVVDPASRNV